MRVSHGLSIEVVSECILCPQDPSCLLSRVLYEISASVCIQVNGRELDDFGVVYNPSESDDQKNEDQKSAKHSRKSRRKRRNAGMRRRARLQFGVENTMENSDVQQRTNKHGRFGNTTRTHPGSTRSTGFVPSERNKTEWVWSPDSPR